MRELSPQVTEGERLIGFDRLSPTAYGGAPSSEGAFYAKTKEAAYSCFLVF